MNIADMLQQTGSLESISRELGIDSATAQRGADALLPAVLGGFKKQAQAGSGGLGGLIGALGGLGGGDLLGSVLSQGATPTTPGNEILGQIFGSRDVSRAVAGQAAQTSGVDPSILKKMLPLIAMAVTGYLSRQQGGAMSPDAAPGASQGGGLGGGLGGGVLGGVLGQVLGGGQRAPGSDGGLGGLASMLDMNGDGNPLDDILSMAGKLGGR